MNDDPDRHHDPEDRHGFDARARAWDEDPKKVARVRRAADAIVAHGILRPDTRLLEFGAGSGMLSQLLREHLGAITVVDRSEGMLEILRDKADGGPLDGATVLDVDLVHDPLPDVQVDLIASVMVMHHVLETERLLRRLHELLAPGGWVALSDLDAEDGTFHAGADDVVSGFDRDELKGLLTELGFVDVSFQDCGVLHKNDRDYPLFLAFARRP
ncbi:MAG: methyltransferase domain-containing protein [Nitriliruptoraceae bacterium]